MKNIMFDLFFGHKLFRVLNGLQVKCAATCEMVLNHLVN